MRLFNRSTGTYPATAAYIGRGTMYGNPFKIGVDGTRSEVIARFRSEVLPELPVEELRGKDLVCHCAPKECHGEAILTKLYGDAWGLI